MKRPLILLSAVALSAVPLAASGGVDDFDNGLNPNGWTWNGFVSSVVEPAGGNPNGWLHGGPGLFALAPILSSSASTGSPWVGDYRANGVTGIEFDAQGLGGPTGSAPMTLVLIDDKGTASVSDDELAFYVDNAVVTPPVGAGWIHYAFVVPSADTSPLPTGWLAGNSGSYGGGFSAGYDWNDLIQNVTKVEIWFFDPQWFGITNTWDVGVDNMEIVCPAGFSLADPAPGIAGQSNDLVVSGGQPGGLIIWGYSMVSAPTTVGCAGFAITIQLAGPTLLGTGVADGNGNATLTKTPPAAAAGLTVHLQAVDWISCTPSNLVSYVFQ